ncbi:MAG: FtsQ-type POTRA domain-containing protein [Candidatus Marinimicrobia bacterium]|nr:FtsQ-type POTRA domain-containing protein [Candidatus Neomarinimicrobiota bacterium]
MKTKKQILKGLKIVSLGVGSLCLLIASFLFFQSSFFNINQVVCFESERPCDTEVWLKINSFFLGKNILFLSPAEAQEKIKKELTTIESVRLEKKWPGRLVISLSKKNPLAVVEVKDGYLQVDHQGTILAILTQPTDLPLVVAPGLSLTANQAKIESAPLLTCLEALYQLLFKNIAVRRAEMTANQTLILDLQTGPQVFFSLDREMKEQVDSLHLILERAKIEGKEMKTIDLRFVKPVVVYL